MVGTPPPKREARVRFSAEPAKGRYGVGERIERTREGEIAGGVCGEWVREGGGRWGRGGGRWGRGGGCGEGGEGGEGGEEGIIFLIYAGRCHDYHLINWFSPHFTPISRFRPCCHDNQLDHGFWLVEQSRAFHEFICIRGSIVSRPKFLQTFYYKSHKIQVFPETLTMKSYVGHEHKPLKSTAWTSNNLLGQSCKKYQNITRSKIYHHALNIRDSTM